MKKYILEKIDMKNLFIAYPPWGRILTNYGRSLSDVSKVFVGEHLTFHLGNDNNHNNSNKKNEMTKINYNNAKVVESNINFNKIT